MATARDKVVRLEEVTPGTVHFKDDNSLLGSRTGDNVGQADFKSASQSKSSRQSEGYSEDDEYFQPQLNIDTLNLQNGETLPAETASEAADVLFPLPDGWPKIPQLFERRSWDFSTSVSPSVNKATSHMELLQTIIEEWCQATETDIRSRMSSVLAKSRPTSTASHATSALQVPGTATSSRKQLRFGASDESKDSDTITEKVGPSRDSRLSFRQPVAGTPQLSVYGIGAKTDEGGSQVFSLPRRYTPQTPEYEIPYLGAEEVIDEVITLLARLENDRRETKETLKKKKKKQKAASATLR